MLERILSDFLSWPALQREVKNIETQFSYEFDVLLHINESELKRCHKRIQRSLLEYLNETDIDDIDGREIITIAVEGACYDLATTEIFTFVQMPKPDASIPANFRSNDELLLALVSDNIRIVFPLYFAVKRIERLVNAVRLDLEIESRFDFIHARKRCRSDQGRRLTGTQRPRPDEIAQRHRSDQTVKLGF